MKTAKIKLIICFLNLLLVLAVLRCGLMAPEEPDASLFIRLIKNSPATLPKTTTSLDQMRCIVTKNGSTVYDNTVTASNGRFRCEVTGLKAGSGYAVLLYGQQDTSIVARGYTDGITLVKGETREVTIAWGFFVPTLISPDSNSTATANLPNFDWTDIDGAANYELLVDNTTDFSSPVIEQSSLSGSTYTARNSLADDTYFWKVRTKDSQSNWSDWSHIWNFSINTKGPAPPTLVSPTDSATINDTTPDFDWNEVSGATNYELLVDNSSDFSSP